METYQLQYKDFDLKAIGNTSEITGVLYDNVLVMLPDQDEITALNILKPILVEWQQIIRQSDLKEVEGMDKNKKIVLRKSTRQIELKIMWQVFRRDNFTCRYCAEDKQPMTVDHVVLWENMGPSIEMNLITSCKKCNNARGNMEYEEWLQSPKYLSQVPQLPVDVLTLNSLALTQIPFIMEHHLRNVKRSR